MSKECPILEIRKIPNFEESHSIRSDGMVCTNERLVRIGANGTRLIKRKFIKPYAISRHENSENPTTYFNLYLDGKRYAISQAALMKITYPELYKPIENKVGEEWVVVSGFENYSVSNMGRVKKNSKLKSVYGIEYLDQERLLVQHANESGVLCVRLFSEDGLSTSKSVLKLVACAFIGLIGSDCVTIPKDGNNSNCVLDNISIISRGGYKGDGFWKRGFTDGV